MNLSEKVELMQKRKFSAEKNVSEFLQRINKVNKNLNIFLSVNPNALKEAKEIDSRIKEGRKTGKLAGICVAIKSNISVKGMENNCASKVLEGYISGYDSSVVKKLKQEDAIILGMVNMDEFACGGSGENSAFGPTKNPVNSSLIPGGSSSGSAAAVAADLCDFSLGSDTGGSIRNPASHCGVFGLKPSYGAVSRYGLIDLSMSLDQIGPLTKNSSDLEYVFKIISGKDELDATSVELLDDSNKIKTIGLVDVSKFCLNKEIEKKTAEYVQEIAKKNKWKVKLIELPLDIAIQAYYVLVYTEFFSSTRKFDGRRFGKKIEDSCGKEVLRRILGGAEISKAEYSGKYYRDALKAKAFVKKQFESLFKDVDLIVLPSVPRLAHKIGEKISLEEMYSYDVFTIPANLGGICGVSMPIGLISGCPVGMQILAPHKKDLFLLSSLNQFK